MLLAKAKLRGVSPDEFRALLKETLGFDVERPFEGVERILCVQPHPDDCELAIGGMLAKLSREGKEITYLTLTDGSAGSRELPPDELKKIRRREQERAAEIIGVKKLLWLDYRDTRLPYSEEVRGELLRIIRSEKPDLVLAPDPWLPYDVHPDHRNAGLLAGEAAFFSALPSVGEGEPWEVRLLGFYYTDNSNYIEDVTGFLKLKLKALKAHESQFGGDWSSWEVFVKSVARFYGEMAGFKYGEGLRILPTVLFHANPLAGVL
ncbi:diacetylchitobiose deacetylase [Thermococcus celericrescens]|uniref:Diacetylchitobiose deacetylase n=1 Tax=Thermococcus celericrescens TaxID=227598 RepID=A0A100XWT2_9EURY|nr:PIG-L deacetylase family protein [Thermococcus celericrescens]KUH32680.1 diacetylchitobiose deacetylase [Thermococcus celericrescens]